MCSPYTLDITATWKAEPHKTRPNYYTLSCQIFLLPLLLPHQVTTLWNVVQVKAINLAI